MEKEKRKIDSALQAANLSGGERAYIHLYLLRRNNILRESKTADRQMPAHGCAAFPEGQSARNPCVAFSECTNLDIIHDLFP